METFMAEVGVWLENNLQGNGKYQQLLSWKDDNSNWPTDLITSLTSFPAEIDDVHVHEADKGGIRGYIIVATQAPDGDGDYFRWQHIHQVDGHDHDTGWVLIEAFDIP